jgi:hypothetical protein
MAHRYTALMAFVVAACLAPSAPASTVVFAGNDPGVSPGGAHPISDAAKAAFAAAAGPLTLIDFESATVGSTGGALDGITSFSMTGNAGGAGIQDTDGGDANGDLGWNTTPGGKNFLRVAPNYNGPDVLVTFSFATPIDAFGAYLTGTETSADGTLTLQFNDGSAEVLPITKNASTGAQYFGFTDIGSSVSSVTFKETGPFTNTRDIWAIDDVSYGVVSSTPEPATLSLLGLGLLAVARRRLGGKVTHSHLGPPRIPAD